ncbi:transmembrane protein 51b [Syngnathus scovelli]|uniref:transmembrane protein 51b n=1 Tax=Syngnathus scovelli TaxID=161590 RepID=UPI00210F8096|nr:transmembrane protein 51b [Syngnathus scovelli]
MCSSRGLCNRGEQPANRSSRSESTGSGAHYALCALGVGLIALGVVMIVWTVIPADGEASGGSSNSSSNFTIETNDEDGKEGELSKSSSVAMVLVGVGLALLLLSICLGVRSKRRANDSGEQTEAPAASAFMDHVTGNGEEVPDPSAFNVPTYEEVVGSSDYPVRQSNLRQSNTHLPSYEDIIAAVENEGRDETTEDSPLNDPVTPPQPAEAAEPQADRQPSLPTRSTSRASRLLRPLRVRRIKSDKLHLKDFRIQIRTPTHNPVTIEPITPPPQYDNKPPELG